MIQVRMPQPRATITRHLADSRIMVEMDRASETSRTTATSMDSRIMTDRTMATSMDSQITADSRITTDRITTSHIISLYIPIRAQFHQMDLG